LLVAEEGAVRGWHLWISRKHLIEYHAAVVCVCGSIVVSKCPAFVKDDHNVDITFKKMIESHVFCV